MPERSRSQWKRIRERYADVLRPAWQRNYNQRKVPRRGGRCLELRLARPYRAGDRALVPWSAASVGDAGRGSGRGELGRDDGTSGAHGWVGSKALCGNAHEVERELVGLTVELSRACRGLRACRTRAAGARPAKQQRTCNPRTRPHLLVNDHAFSSDAQALSAAALE